MQKKYTKKIIGTVVMAVFVLSLTLVGYTYAQAQGQNNDNNKSYKFSGVVSYDPVCSDNGSLIIYNDGIIPFEINNKTTFTHGLDCSDIYIEDNVHIIAKMVDGNYVAKVVQKDNGAGYGRDW